MVNFAVKDKASIYAREGEILQVGVVPGEFDTKQIMLGVLIIMSNPNIQVRFVRSLDINQLKYCKLFITDAFASQFPSIPAHNNIQKVWTKNYKGIVKKYLGTDVNPKYILENVKEILDKLENFDIIRTYNNPRDENQGFANAIQACHGMLETILHSQALDCMHDTTIRILMDNLQNGILELPIRMNWRNIIKEHQNRVFVKFVIIPEAQNLYRIEHIDEEVDVRELVKGYKNLKFSGKFYAKVGSIDEANELAKSLILFESSIQTA